MLRRIKDLKGVAIALGFQKLSGDASKFWERELVAVVDPILKQGGGAASGGFQLENLALEIVLADARLCERRWVWGYGSPQTCCSEWTIDAAFRYNLSELRSYFSERDECGAYRLRPAMSERFAIRNQLLQRIPDGALFFVGYFVQLENMSHGIWAFRLSGSHRTDGPDPCPKHVRWNGRRLLTPRKLDKKK